MQWLIQSLMEKRSEWTSASRRELTPQHRGSTWADPLGPVRGLAGMVTIETEMTDIAGDLQVPTDAGHHHLHVLAIATDHGPGVTLPVVITEIDRAGND